MELDAYQIVVDLLSQSHAYGEAIAGKMELWISVSFGLIVMAYFAPNRLMPGIACLVLLIYVAFSVFSITNIYADIQMGKAAIDDAAMLLTTYELESKQIETRLEDNATGSGVAIFIFLAGLFLGTIGYVSHTAYTTYKGRREGI